MERNTIEKIFNFLKEKEGKELPKNWNIIERLENHPDDIQYRYDGILSLSHSNITKLPNDLYVDGSLFLVETNITKLPDKLYVDRSLSLKGCGELTQLPDNLYVGGFLDLANTNVTKLPNNLYVGDSLNLYGCKQIKDLPNNLQVGGDVLITGTQLADKYTDEEIYDIVASTGGTLIGKIFR